MSLNQRRFVVQMAVSATKKEAAEAVGLSKHTIYNWPPRVMAAVALYQEHIRTAAAEILAEAAAKAALIKVAGLDSDDERVRQRSASELLERAFGRPTQRQEVSGPDGGELKVTLNVQGSDAGTER